MVVVVQVLQSLVYGPTISGVDIHLISAVHRDRMDFLPATQQSVSALRSAVSDQFSILWHVVIDGVGPPGAPVVGADTCVWAQHNLGVSAARNIALSNTGGSGWVFRLDGDDLVDVAGWLGLLSDPLFGSELWHPTNVVTLQGEKTPHWFNTSRRWDLCEVEQSWSSPMMFHPNNVVADTSLVLTCGGWPALRVNEDILFCFTPNSVAAGLALPHVTLKYRKWEHQSVNGSTYAADKAAAFRFILASVNARRARAGMFPIFAPAPSVGSLYLPK